MTKRKHPFEELKKWKAPAADKAKPAQKPPQRSPARRPAGDSKDDESLEFHRLMSGVTPLAHRGRVPKSAHSDASAPDLERTRAMREAGQDAAEREAEEVHAHLRALVDGATRFEVNDDGERVEGRRLDVTPDVLRKLRRGIFPIDARLDLHGQRAGQARAAVESFLRDKRTRGERCVLVIHGKGEHAPGGEGVLRGEIAAWLAQGPASTHVAAFATAVREDGGEGAVYVLLRR
jgi:DNA-nicking Smr family endonuclease